MRTSTSTLAVAVTPTAARLACLGLKVEAEVARCGNIAAGQNQIPGAYVMSMRDELELAGPRGTTPGRPRLHAAIRDLTRSAGLAA